VEVGTRCPARLSHRTDHSPFAYRIAPLDEGPVQVGVTGRVSLRVTQND